MGVGRTITFALVMLAACAASAVAQTPAGGDGRRVALVIGNQSYGEMGVLTNPVRDARAISASLRTSGFATVVEAEELDIETFQRSLREFRRVADGASIAVIYFAGHGMEVNGINWLVPLKASITSPESLQQETVALDQMLNTLSGATVKVLILDACRNNPFERSLRLRMGGAAARSSTGDAGGLGAIKQAALPSGMLVIYATEPGTTASDGLPSDANSPFARALIAELPTRGVDLRLVAGGVTERTMEYTGQMQRPFVTSMIIGRAPVFLAGEAQAATAPPPPAASAPTAAEATRMFNRAKAAGAGGDCQALIDVAGIFPNTDIAAQAQAELVRCRASYLSTLVAVDTSPVSDAEWLRLATEFQVDPAAVKAVAKAEGGVSGFAPTGRLVVLFEPHLFSRATARRFDATNPNVSYPSWDNTRYPRTQEGRWAQIAEAYALDPEAAVGAASWGRFQILGRNFASSGYGSATEFVAAISKSEAMQARAFLTFVKSAGALDELQRLDWERFAAIYHGPDAVAQNAARLRAAYAQVTAAPPATPPR